MKQRARIILTSVLVIVFIAGTVALRLNVNVQRSGLTCNDITICFKDSLKFISESDIKGWMDSKYGPYIGQRIDSIRLEKIEKILDSQSAVLKSEAYIADDGILHISISQRSPVIRFNKGWTGFYADQRGYIFPLQKSYDAKVPVIEGNIPVSYSEGYKGVVENEQQRLWLCSVIDMIDQIHKNKRINGKLEKISVNAKGDLILKLNDGKEKFIIGMPYDIKDKLERIEKYYTFIKDNKNYEYVNVKFDNEIICK